MLHDSPVLFGAFQFLAEGEIKKMEVDTNQTIPKPGVVFCPWNRAGQNQATHGQPLRSSSPKAGKKNSC